MTIVRIQIDEKRDRIGFSLNKLASSTPAEIAMADAVQKIAQAAVGEAVRMKNTKIKKEETHV